MRVEFSAGLDRVMVNHAYACHPNESCGLLAGDDTGRIVHAYPMTNVLDSPTNYTLDPDEHMAVIREAEGKGWDIVGVFHSHPHTKAYPSPTDVTLAPDPTWLYVVIGMERLNQPVVAGFRIVDGDISRESIHFEQEQ